MSAKDTMTFLVGTPKGHQKVKQYSRRHLRELPAHKRGAKLEKRERD